MMYCDIDCFEWRYLRGGQRNKATVWHKAHSMTDLLHHVEICLPFDTIEIRPRWKSGLEPMNEKNRVRQK